MVAGSKPLRRLKWGAVPSVFSHSHSAEASEVCAAKRLKTVQLKTVQKLEVGRVWLFNFSKTCCWHSVKNSVEFPKLTHTCFMVSLTYTETSNFLLLPIVKKALLFVGLMQKCSHCWAFAYFSPVKWSLVNCPIYFHYHQNRTDNKRKVKEAYSC